MAKVAGKKLRFCIAYLETGSATKAWLAAGMPTTRKSWHMSASLLLADPAVQETIDDLRQQQLDVASITVERIANEYKKLAFFDPRQLYDEDGRMRELHELPADVAAAIASVEVVTQANGSVLRKIKWHDKKGALDSLGKWRNMFIDRSEVKVGMTVVLSTEDQGVL